MRFWFLIVRLSFKWMFRVNLGDLVWYQGKKYVVANGVRQSSWRLHGLANRYDGWVRRTECRKSYTPKNLFGSFRTGYRFYMINWYEIWKREGIQPWMRECNIW